MFLSCDDLKLCTDRIAHSTDNPLGSRRCRYRATGECPEIERTQQRVACAPPPGAGSLHSRHCLHEHIAEVATLLDDASVSDVSCLAVNNTLIYLLGTDHVNPRCQKEVSKIISLVRPDKVVVELCKLRACRCPSHMDSVFQNPAHFNFSYLKKVISEIGFIPAFIFMADVFNEMEVSGNINLEFGGEMTGAIRQAKSVHECQLLLGDRPISLTIMRRASAMSWWTKIRLIVQVSLGLACRPLRAILLSNAHRVAESDPMTQYIFVFERDLCLVNALQMAAAANHSNDLNGFSKIVAVVGGGHIKGIHEYWGKMVPEIARLIYEPKFDKKFC